MKLGRAPLCDGACSIDWERELAEEFIYFQGPSNSVEPTQLQNKLIHIRREIQESYFDEEEKVLAIPNFIPVRGNPYIEGDKNSEFEEKERMLKNEDIKTLNESMEISKIEALVQKENTGYCELF